MKKKSMLFRLLSIVMSTILIMGSMPLMDLRAEEYVDETVTAETLSFSSDIITVSADVKYDQTNARKMIDMLNNFRQEEGVWAWNQDNVTKTYYPDLGTVSYDYNLEKLAMQRAAEIAFNYGHVRSDGSTLDGMFSSYQQNGYGEAIAAGTSMDTIEKAFECWREEEEDYDGQCHRRNMLLNKVHAVAIAHVIYNNNHYWTMELVGRNLGEEATAAIDNENSVNVDIKTSSVNDIEISSTKTECQINSYSQVDIL